MVFKRRLIYIMMSIILISIFTACQGTLAEEEMYNHLEESVLLERDFVQQQSDIIDLEKQEQEIYEQITKLGMNDFDEIKQLSEQAKGIIAERLDRVTKEQESMNASQAEFVKIEDLIEKIKDENVVEKANEMYDAMIKRYDVYDKLNKTYKNSLSLEEELYTLIQLEDVEEAEITLHIETLNDSYQLVLDFNDEFNEATSEYNLLKKEFYDVANLNVAFEGN